jgi:two-component sensor histidine kinase
LTEPKDILQKILNREIYYHEDERCFLNANGDKVYIKSIIFPVTYLNRVAAQINLIDITTSFLYEENLEEINKELNTLVDEKNMLLKEVHHRVKNNLQIMLSLINLDSRYHPNDSDQVLGSAKNRINAMALMHEKIYRSSDLAHINIKEYIKTEVNYLFDLYGVENIEINYLLDDLELSMDTAIPLGLIINEMIINVIKYAFPNGEDGKLSIILHASSNKVTLILADNGVGAPKDLDAENSSSLGLTVVRGLVNQINGSITRLDRPGTAYMVEFLLE